MLKPGTPKYATWMRITPQIKQLLPDGKLMEAAILIDVRDVITEKRPSYMKGWTEAQITEHFRKFHQSIADGTHPYIAEMTYE